MKVSVIGAGYVGLVSGACLAEKGHQVVCIDVDAAKVDSINAATPPIYEAGLEDLLRRNVGRRLTASTDLCQAVLNSDLTLIAVGTPFDGDEIDLTFIRQAARQIGEALKEKNGWHMVTVKSTVVPGTTESVVLPTIESASGKVAGRDFGVGMNPEFLREGEAIADFMNPDRIVMGGVDPRSIDALRELYRDFQGVDTVATNCRTAEMIKYAANSLLATMISFSNEVANLCAATGKVDVTEVMKGVHLDKRLSPILDNGTRLVPPFTTYIEAGCGFGGSCFPKDVKALVAYGDKVGAPMPILNSVIQTNMRQPLKMIEILHKHFDDLDGKKIAVLGLAFKPGSDDIRESPAIPILESLLAEGAVVRAYDPVAGAEAYKRFANASLTCCDNLENAIDGVDALLLITRWPEFNRIPELLERTASTPLVVDGRRMLDKMTVAHYDGIGL